MITITGKWTESHISKQYLVHENPLSLGPQRNIRQCGNYISYLSEITLMVCHVHQLYQSIHIILCNRFDNISYSTENVHKLW